MRRVVIAALAMVLGWSSTMPAAEAQNYPSGGTLRVGAFGQASRVELSAHGTNSGTTTELFTSAMGWGGGVAAGYDLRVWNSWIIGLELDASLDNARGRANSARGLNSDYFASLRARLGYNLSPSWLLYGTAGYGLHGLEYRGQGGTTTAPTKTYGTQGGLTIGGGAEYDLESYTVFVEVLHTTYERWSFPAQDIPFRFNVDDTSNLFRLGVKFKIGYDYDHDIYARSPRRY